MIPITEDLYKFLQDNYKADIMEVKLRLAGHNLPFNLDFALTQLECRKKHGSKLKFLLQNPKFLFPDSISGEQASHQAVARFHASLMNSANSSQAEENLSVLDMTAGLGADAISFALSGFRVTAIELDKNKADMLDFNAKLFSPKNLKVINDDSINFLKNSAGHFDIIFIDPARRSDSNKRLYNLHDCLPDVIENQKLLSEKASRIFIKASPMLDIAQTLRDFDNTQAIRVIGVKGECKEVLVEISNLPRSLSSPSNCNEEASLENYGILIEAINLDNEGRVINLFRTIHKKELPCSSEVSNTVRYADEKEIQEGTYLLEPSAMVMKIAPWKEICHRFEARKFAPSSHLFISSRCPDNFPGRVSIIRKILKKNDRKALIGLPASVVSKNHPLSSQELRKSLKIKEGDNNFIYASRLGSKPVLILSEALN